MLSAYHGEFLKDFNVSHSSAFDAWLSDQRNLYQSQYLHQLLAAEKEAYYAGKLDLAEKYGTEYIAIDPLEESAFSTLMQVYRDQKKFRKALGLYHTLCKNLSDEFSISPLKETSALYYQIVDAWNTSTYKLEVGSDQQLIGKDAVLHKLVSLCNGSRLESDKICALIQGKTGVGKTYLINYILHQYDFSGWAICQASCYQSEMNTVLAPWNTIMLQLIPKFESENIRIPDVYIKTAAGLFPCLSVECQHNFSGISSDYPAGADYLAALESTLLILSTVAKKVPVLLILEDIHWIDNNSADLLSMLLHRLRSTNITIICTSRDILQPYAQQVLNNAVRDKLLDVYNIDAFSQEETTRFVNFYAPGRYSQKEIDNLYQSTEGNGLFLVQLLDSMHESNGLKNIPASADSIIQMRLAGLSSDELQVLDVISVFRDWAPFDILTSLLTKTPLELLYLCDQLKQKNLLTESTRGKVLGYSFTHERVKAMLSQRQSESARRILHLRAAQYLEAQLGSDGSTDLYDQLVQHFTAGGDTFKAFKYKVLSLDAFAGMCYEPHADPDRRLGRTDSQGGWSDRLLSDPRARAYLAALHAVRRKRQGASTSSSVSSCTSKAATTSTAANTTRAFPLSASSSRAVPPRATGRWPRTRICSSSTMPSRPMIFPSCVSICALACSINRVWKIRRTGVSSCAYRASCT